MHSAKPKYTVDDCFGIEQCPAANKYQRHEVPVAIAQKTLGYSTTSSVASQVIATLSYYGLISSKGLREQRKIQVTDRAFTILMDKREESPERGIALREAALNPAIFKKLFDKYPRSIPADDILQHELIFSYNFNTSSVNDFVRIFRRTMKFAKVYESGIISEESDTTQENEPIMERDEQTTEYKGHIGLAGGLLSAMDAEEHEIAKYPVGRDITIRLIASGAITQKSIDHIL